AWIYSKNVFTRYPFQGSLYGLPPSVIKECIVGAIESRFGPIRKQKMNGAAANGRSRWSNTAACGAGTVSDCCADGVIESTAPLGHGDGNEPRNFEEFIYKV